MALKTILVHVADDDQYKKRLKVAIALARRNKAHVTALHVTSSTDARAAVIGRAASARFSEAAVEDARKKAEEMKADFNAACVAKKVSHRWVVEDGDHLELLEEHARVADLVIVSQSKNRYLEDFFRHQLPEQIVVKSGCPVLIIPRKWRVKTTISSILIAWKSDREAVRSVRDSLEFLKKAKRVQALTVSHGEELDGLPVDQLIMYLARHGIDVEHIHEDHSDVSEAIIETSIKEDHDMVVMGGFGQSRIKEMVLGSVTNTVLRKMKLPVLISY